MHGPYGATGVDLHNHKYKEVALISGGIGVTPMNSVANQLLHHHTQGRPLDRLYFITSFRELILANSILTDQFSNYLNSKNDKIECYLHLSRGYIDPEAPQTLVHPILQSRPDIP